MSAYYKLTVYDFCPYSGIQNVLVGGSAVGTTIVAVLYALNPAIVMNYFMYWLISIIMAYISTPAAIGVLSFINFGKYLAGMIQSHNDDPATCAASCK